MSDTTASLVYGFKLTELEYKQLFEEEAGNVERSRLVAQRQRLLQAYECQLIFHGDAVAGKSTALIVASGLVWTGEVTEAPRPVDAMNMSASKRDAARIKLTTVAYGLGVSLEHGRLIQWYVIVSMS